MALVALMSGGKDSWYAAWLMSRRGFSIACAVVMLPRRDDSWMFHVPRVKEAAEFIRSGGIPVIEVETSGEKEKELEDLERALREAMNRYGVEGVVSGAIASRYQRSRIDRLARKLGLNSYAPLWGVDPKAYMRRLIRDGFRFKIVSVAADGLGKEWVGRVLDREDVERLIELADRYRFHPAGEGGEYETLVVEAPVF